MGGLVGGYALAVVCVHGCAAPRHPPASGPVGATGTCWAATRVPVRDAGVAPDEAGMEYGYRFDDDDATRVSFVVERGQLRDLSVVVPPGYGPNDVIIAWSSTQGSITDQAVPHGRATGLHLPLVVGEWAKADVALRNREGGEPGARRTVHLRVLGDTAEARIGDEPALLTGECVWGRVDPDSP